MMASQLLMASPIQDRAAIETLVESVGLYADAGQFELLEALYADEVEVDYRSLNGGDIELKSRQALMSQWAAVLPGFDLTRHKISNTQVELKGAEASASAHVRAVHYVGDLSWTVEGEYRYQLSKLLGEWKIRHHTFLLKTESGTREVFGPAIEQAANKPVAYIRRQQTERAVRDFLVSLETKDMALFASVWAEDAIQDMPYAPDNFPNKVVGRDNIIAHYAAWPENSGKADFTSALVFYPMQDPNLVFAEFKGDVDIIPTGRKYLQHYGGLFHVEGGKIRLFREYFNPTPFVYAFGLEGSE